MNRPLDLVEAHRRNWLEQELGPNVTWTKWVAENLDISYSQAKRIVQKNSVAGRIEAPCACRLAEIANVDEKTIRNHIKILEEASSATPSVECQPINGDDNEQTCVPIFNENTPVWEPPEDIANALAALRKQLDCTV